MNDMILRGYSSETCVDSSQSDNESSNSVSSLYSLNDRILPPLVGFGTFNSFTDHDKVASAVKEAIKCGYRHFDLAKLYENEKEVGAAIRECIDEGLVCREDLYICSKLWCDDHDPKDVEPALVGTLERLGLSYVDNYMMHWPSQWKSGTGTRVSDEFGGGFKYEVVHVCDVEALAKTWKAMESLVRKGLTRSLGVSNFDHILLGSLLERCKIKPITNEIEMHPYLAQNDLLQYCQSHDIHVVAYSPLGKPGYKNPGDLNLLDDPVVVSIAEALNRTPGQVVLRWNIQRGVSVIPKSLTTSRIKSNIDILDWCLSVDEMAMLDQLDRHHRYVQVPWFDFNLYDSRRERIMLPTAHPELPNQPLVKPGSTDERGVYMNSFGRDGRRLESEIFMKRGVIKELDQYCRELLPAVSLDSKNYVVTDEIVYRVLDVENNFIKAMEKAGVTCKAVVIPAETSDESGEASVEPYKTTTVLNNCVEMILKEGITKHSCIISVGGGVVNNLCGVLASMLYRGIGLVHFTTTTMGMLDAALDFKQAVNHSRGKNLLGCYYPASKVVIDPECVSSLSTRHIQNGIAEAIKHAFCQSEEMVNRIVEPVRKRGSACFRDGEYLEMICKDCIEIKAPTLDNYHNSDFNEMCPQYGHAVGHAVESLSWSTNSPLLHGEAVAIGMCVSAEVALMRGLCDSACVEKHYDAILTLGLPAYIPSSLTVESVMNKMVYDKHYVKSPAMGLCASIGVMAVNETQNKASFAFQITNEELQRAMSINIERGSSGVGLKESKIKGAQPVQAATVSAAF